MQIDFYMIKSILFYYFVHSPRIFQSLNNMVPNSLQPTIAFQKALQIIEIKIIVREGRREKRSMCILLQDFMKKSKVKLIWSKKIPLAPTSLLHTDHQLLLLKTSKPEEIFYFECICVCPWVKRTEVASLHASITTVSLHSFFLFSCLFWDEIIFHGIPLLNKGRSQVIFFKLSISLTLNVNVPKNTF